MKATVYKSTGSRYLVKNDQGEEFYVRIKGKFKIDNITSTNPIAVGDRVSIQNEEDEGSMVIAEIYPRENYINRISPHNKNQHHIVASNLDQSLLFVTLKEPKTSLGFIDRFLITSEAYHVPAIIVFNKVDLFGPKDIERMKYIESIYSSIGYSILQISLEQNDGVDQLHALLKNKTTLLSGHSGVGKSSFINTIFPDINIKTQDVSNWSGKGMHTTTFAEMYDLPEGGRIIDTPGIREMGLVDIEKSELAHYFPEMKNSMSACQFNNCIHINEPGCAIKKAVSESLINEDRYFSYLNILDSLSNKKY